jgi:TonB family protein
MSAAILETTGWSRSQWSAALSVMVVLHLLGLFFLSEKRPKTSHPAPPLSNIYYVGDPGVETRLGELLALQDPTVFVQMDPPNIVRANLRTMSRLSYELTNWTAPVRWLAPSSQYFADDFNLYVAGAVRPSTLLTEKMPPVVSEITSSTRQLPAHAVLRIEGDLAGRRLLSNQPLPTNESRAILTNTVVRVVVDAAGDTLWATLFYGSGSPKADQNALAFAKQARFEKLPESDGSGDNAKGDRLAFGHLIFQWFPAPVLSTNQLSARQKG